MAVDDWSTVADENVEVSGIDISEGCPAANVNNAIREVMASVKEHDADLVHLSGDEVLEGLKAFASVISGDISGNAGTATALATARNINGTSFDGTASITTGKWGTARNVTVTDADGTNAGEAVSVDGSGNVALKLPAVIKANLVGAVTGSLTGSVTGSLSGNASTATKLQTTRTISLEGDVVGSASFDGSANAAIIATVADDSHSHVIANIDNLQSALDSLSSGKADDSDVVHTSQHMTVDEVAAIFA